MIRGDSMTWWDEAACHTRDPELFDIGLLWRVNGDLRKMVNQAKACCSACPVRRSCLAAAYREEAILEPYGVRGGTTPAERWPSRRPPKRRKPVR
jgi:hypothetical protein